MMENIGVPVPLESVDQLNSAASDMLTTISQTTDLVILGHFCVLRATSPRTIAFEEATCEENSLKHFILGRYRNAKETKK